MIVYKYTKKYFQSMFYPSSLFLLFLIYTHEIIIFCFIRFNCFINSKQQKNKNKLLIIEYINKILN